MLVYDLCAWLQARHFITLFAGCALQICCTITGLGCFVRGSCGCGLAVASGLAGFLVVCVGDFCFDAFERDFVVYVLLI